MESNYEYGLDRPDIVVKDAKNRRVLIVEVKYSSGQEQLEADCRNALKQIDVKEYAGKFLDGYREVICYGAAFCRKQCLFRKWEK